MMRSCISTLFFATIFAFSTAGRAQTAPSDTALTAPASEPSDRKTDLLGPVFVSHVHGIEFRPPLNSVKVDRPGPDSIAEFDQNDYDWQLKAWLATLQHPLALTIHKDQFGNPQDGVMEVTLANIKAQTPNAQILRNEVITVGRLRVGIIAVRYETADHDRRFTQEAIVEAPQAQNKLYYFLDLTGPGKPKFEPDDIVNPAEKAAFDTFSQVVDSIALLDRSSLVAFQDRALYGSMGLFVIWGGDNYALVKNALQPEQYRRIISNGRDVGYEHIVEDFQPNGRSPEASILKIGVRSHMVASPLRIWDTETWMFSSADRKHEHWKTTAQCTDNRGRIVDSFSQVGMSDEQTRAFAIQPREQPDGSLLPDQDSNAEHRGPLGQGNVDIETHRSLTIATTHQRAQMNPFHMDVPVFYIPQAYSFLLPEILPLKPKTYMFATFVASPPENTSAASVGNVHARYVEVLPVQHVNFRGQDFDAIPITDKIDIDGTPTTIYRSLQGKFLGSTIATTDGDKTTTIEIIPTDAETLGHIWKRPDLTAPTAPANDNAPSDNSNSDSALPPPPPQ